MSKKFLKKHGKKSKSIFLSRKKNFFFPSFCCTVKRIGDQRCPIDKMVMKPTVNHTFHSNFFAAFWFNILRYIPLLFSVYPTNGIELRGNGQFVSTELSIELKTKKTKIQFDI